jgi:FKBP-type peptidyl-prolyl cis-trans isomerase
MKIRSVVLSVLALAVAASACAQQSAPAAAATVKPESLDDRASYSIGLNLGRNFRQQDVPVNLDYLLQGLRDGLSESAEALLDDTEVNSTLQEFQKQVVARQQERMAAEAETNRAKAEEFLAANQAKEGVTTTDSGLQYQVLTAGDGPKPAATDQVTVHYRGTLLDGTVFDSSYDRGEPATFPVGGVIPGWREALQLMSVGSKWMLWVPPSLAYGDRGTPGGPIGPNQVLTFEVELLGIAPPAGDASGGEAPSGGNG